MNQISSSELLTLPSFAKVNLSLRVLGKRADGYHELRTIFQIVTLYDELTFEPLEDGRLGTLVAYDPVKQEIRWRVPEGNSRYGGTLSTASNLVFQVAPNGRLIAYSADKGDKLLELPTGMRNGMGPPITFAVDGKQYIALMGGSGGTPSPGTNKEPATPMKPRLLVFGLDGKAELPQSVTAPVPASPDTPHQQ